MLELVEGPTLADRIAKGSIPVDEALSIAKQNAEALEAAHEAGVIHRDLKPANIKVRDDSTVKVLDFGLAKALAPSSEQDPSQSPTLTAAATQMGVILGTAAYMAPEQAKGKPVDKRADIWAFGAVLFEMLTGQRPLSGETVSETLASVMMREPDWDLLPEDLPAALGNLVRKCLEKDPRERVRDMGDARLAMHGAFETSAGPPSDASSVSPLRVWQRGPVVGLIAVGAAAVGIVVWTATRPAPAVQGVSRFAVAVPPEAPLFRATVAPNLAISSDGERVVYVSGLPGETQLYSRPLDDLVGAPLRGTDGAFGPFLSPDGQSVGFIREFASQLFKVSTLGGASVTVAESPSLIYGASWGADDRIVFGTLDAGLFRVSGGGDPEVLTTVQGGLSHRWPFVIPGRDAVLFTMSETGSEAWSSDITIAVLDLSSGELRSLELPGSSPHYLESGHLVYVVEDGSIYAVSFDVASLEVTGNPVLVVERVSVTTAGAAAISVSPNGRLVYEDGQDGGLTSRLVVTQRDGGSTRLAEIDGVAWYPRYAHDGGRVAFAIAETRVNSTDADLWVLDVGRSTRTRLTFGGNNNRFYPTWSPDGTRLAYAEGSQLVNRVMVTSADGNGLTETLLERGERQFPMSWSADGRWLALYRSVDGTANRDLEMLDLESDDLTPQPFLSTPYEERGVSFSPNGRWLAYVSDESGQNEVYVRPYPGPGGEHVVSSGGGGEAVWSRDGSELFYRNGGQLMAVQVDTGDTWAAGTPEQLFEESYVADNAVGGGGNPNYDVSPDGQQVVFVESDALSGTSPLIHVVLNWHEELLERVPVP